MSVFRVLDQGRPEDHEAAPALIQKLEAASRELQGCASSLHDALPTDETSLQVVTQASTSQPTLGPKGCGATEDAAEGKDPAGPAGGAGIMDLVVPWPHVLSAHPPAPATTPAPTPPPRAPLPALPPSTACERPQQSHPDGSATTGPFAAPMPPAAPAAADSPAAAHAVFEGGTRCPFNVDPSACTSLAFLAGRSEGNVVSEDRKTTT